MLIKIPCDWFLTDDILTNVRLGAPMRVMDALTRTGEIQTDPLLVSRQKNEWAYRRIWRYSAAFMLPALEGTRSYLILEGLCGRWNWIVNGISILSGDSSRAEAEVTRALKEGENCVEIEFMPEPHSVLFSQRGFWGQMLFKSTGSRSISSFMAEIDDEDSVRCLVRLDALCSADVSLVYTLKTAQETRTETVFEAVSPGVNHFEHRPFAGMPKGRKAEMLVEIFSENEKEDEAAYPLFTPETLAPLRGFASGDVFTMALIQKAGGNCALCESSQRSRMLAADRGLVVAWNTDFVRTALPCAQRWETVTEMTGGLPMLFKNGAIFAMSGLKKDALDHAYKAIQEPGDDHEAAFHVSRYLQAVSLRADAEEARRKNEAFLLKDVRDISPVAVSCALFDADDRPRPAYYALTDAWKNEHAYVKMPSEEPRDEIAVLPVYYLTDKDMGIATVSARAYSLDGRELVSANFPVLGGNREPIGRLLAEIPEDGKLVVRTAVLRDGDVISSSDALMVFDDSALSDIDKTQLLFRNGAIENAGRTAAVGVTIPGAEYFGILLPGESVLIPKGKPNRAEGLNTIY